MRRSFPWLLTGVALLSVPALAWAPNTFLIIRAPINGGIFDSFGIAHPSYHHRPWGGDWAVDFYGPPGSRIAFSIKEYEPSTTPAAPYGVVSANASTCADPSVWAGTAYKIDVYDGADEHVGWVLYAHVDTTGYGLLPIGTRISSGRVLGTTAQYTYSSCYQVTTTGGVHTHVEMYNNDDYSCYVPWSSGTVLGSTRALGAIGTDNTGAMQSCW